MEEQNAKANNLAAQVGALDSESEKTENGRILELVSMAVGIVISTYLEWI